MHFPLSYSRDKRPKVNHKKIDANRIDSKYFFPQTFLPFLFTKSWKSSLIENYLQSLKSPRKDVAVGHYIFSEPHHGEIGLHWQEAYLWGILSLNHPDLRSKYLRLFEEGLRKRN